VVLDGTELVADLRRLVTMVRDQARSGQRIALPRQLNPLPWRLTTLAREIVNKRLLRISYPHYTPVCNIDSDSFINRAGIWRTANKLIAFLVLLVPALRGFVPKFRTGLRSLIWGLRILEGQTLSVTEADTLHLERGFKALKKSDIQRARTLIIEGLSIIEGCCPVCCLVPAMHCLCHYADGAELHGLLRLLWMISFGLTLTTVSLFVKPYCNIIHLSLQKGLTKSAKISRQTNTCRSQVWRTLLSAMEPQGIFVGDEKQIRQGHARFQKLR
jgi:hypothetical protein